MSTGLIRLAVSGCCGRMGSLILEEALRDKKHFQVVAAVEQPGHPQIGKPLANHPDRVVGEDLKSLLTQADLLIEFTTAEASLLHADLAAKMKVPMVIGTTGFSEEQFSTLRHLSRQIPIFWSPNMSLGIFILRRLICFAFELLKSSGLSDSTAVRISETHHVHKKDKPSGTAKQLAQEVMAASGKPAAEIPIEAKREGEVVGLHTVHLDLGSERISLEHEAMDRSLFAKGALLAARHFLAAFRDRPGWYGMDDLMAR